MVCLGAAVSGWVVAAAVPADVAVLAPVLEQARPRVLNSAHTSAGHCRRRLGVAGMVSDLGSRLRVRLGQSGAVCPVLSQMLQSVTCFALPVKNLVYRSVSKRDQVLFPVAAALTR